MDAQVIVVTDDGGDGGSALVYDGTSGKECKTDADCTTPTGPGINKCSNDFDTFVVTNVKTELVPTPICIVPPPTTANTGTCDPAPPADLGGLSLHFCDGPDLPTSPGICFALTNPPSPGLGVCLPVCTFALDGTAPVGCPGKDTCFPFTVGIDQNNNATGYGYCQGSCQADADCSALGAGFVCQTDIGACTKSVVKRTKAIGAACAADPTVMTAANDNATGACNCLPDNTTNQGFCTSACIVGGDPCPMGWICDNLQPSEIPLPDGTLLAVTKENTGTPGVCMPACSLTAEAGAPAGDSGGATDSGAAAAVDGGGSPGCPGNSLCEAITPVGPDCVP
jgi:hypothetical protein